MISLVCIDTLLSSQPLPLVSHSSFPPTGEILAFILKHYFKINKTKVALALQ